MKVGVIGCGASGMMAAITAAKGGHKVTVIEHTSKIGKKILMTGNGKCNFTNAVIHASNYNDSARVLFESVYNMFDNKDTIDFFESIGIKPYEKNGYFYPRSEQASSITEALGYALYKNSVNIIKECNIETVIHKSTGYDKFMKAVNSDNDEDMYEGFKVVTDKGDFDFDKVIIAAGSACAKKTGSDGSGYEIAKSLGHRIVPPLPALCALKCDGNWFDTVSGVRCQVKVSLLVNDKYIKSSVGELQLTDYGLSGIPVFQLSADAVRALSENKDVSIDIDFYYEAKDSIEMADIIYDTIRKTPEKSSEEFLSGMLNRKLCQALIDICGIGRSVKCNALMDEEIRELAEVIKSLNVSVSGYNEDNAQVYSGGVNCNDLKNSLESRVCRGLYFAGEIIDVNGDCGGYNLQWAWSSGYIAGQLR